MASIVGAFGLSHILFNDQGVEEKAERVMQGFLDVGQRCRALKPDLIVLASDDHMYNIDTGVQVPLAVGTADAYDTFGDTDVPLDVYRGNRDFAEGFVKFAADKGFDLAKLEREGFKLDHGFAVPLMFMTPDQAIPVVPVNININMDPSPTPDRCWNLGQQLKTYIETVRPAGERVVVAGAGGLSHWLMVERDGEINEQWDNEVLDLFAAGRASELAELSTDAIADVAGNGGTEIRNWLFMAGAVPGWKGERIFYEPMHQWKTGMGAVQLTA